MKNPAVDVNSKNQVTYLMSIVDDDTIMHNIIMQDGNFALHAACMFGYTDVVALLLSDPRTDVAAMDHHGRTAQQCIGLQCRAYARPAIESLFEQYGSCPWLK